MMSEELVVGLVEDRPRSAEGRPRAPSSPTPPQQSSSSMQTAKNVLKSPRLAFKRDKSPRASPTPPSATTSPNLTVPGSEEKSHGFRLRHKSGGKSPTRNKDKSPNRNRHKSEPSPTEPSKPITEPTDEDKYLMSELGLTQQQIQEYREAFTLVDKDGDGRITTAELSSVMKFLKNSVSQEQVEVMIDQADIDGNGTVEFDEFLKMMARRKAPEEEAKSLDDQMREFFKVFDRDGNGFIDAQELHYTMTNLGEEISDADVKEMIREADLDGDGRINYEEFIKMMQIKQQGNKKKA